MTSLKQRLIDEYGGLDDERITRLDSGTIIIVDDRGPGVRDAKKRLFSWFCEISAELPEPQPLSLFAEPPPPLTPGALIVTLTGGVPDSADVQSWAQTHGAEHRPAHVLRFEVAPGEQSRLRSLAQAIEAIVSRPYSVSAYKHVCPRTAASLERLARVLDQAWGEST